MLIKMYYSSIFLFSLVIVILLSERVTGRSQLNSDYETPQYKHQVEVLDIGNGNYKHNVIDFGSNANSAGPTQHHESQPEVQGNRFGHSPPTYNNNPINPGTPRPNPYRGSAGEIGHGYENHNTASLNTDTRTIQTQNRPYNTRNNGGTSFLSEAGLFNVGYGINNDNRILVNGRPIQPTAPVNSGSRTPQTQSRAGNNNHGYGPKPNIKQVYVNGQPIQPIRNDGPWSTYQVNGETIHVLNTE